MTSLVNLVVVVDALRPRTTFGNAAGNLAHRISKVVPTPTQVPKVDPAPKRTVLQQFLQIVKSLEETLTSLKGFEDLNNHSHQHHEQQHGSRQ